MRLCGVHSEVTAALVAGPVGRAETGEPVTQLRLRGDVVLLVALDLVALDVLDGLSGNRLASRRAVTASRCGRSNVT
jgi:hypothetical protein